MLSEIKIKTVAAAVQSPTRQHRRKNFRGLTNQTRTAKKNTTINNPLVGKPITKLNRRKLAVEGDACT